MNKDDDIAASVAYIIRCSTWEAEQKKVMHEFYTGELVEQVVLCWKYIATFLEFVRLLCHHPCSVTFYFGLLILLVFCSMTTINSANLFMAQLIYVLSDETT